MGCIQSYCITASVKSLGSQSWGGQDLTEVLIGPGSVLWCLEREPVDATALGQALSSFIIVPRRVRKPPISWHFQYPLACKFLPSKAKSLFYHLPAFSSLSNTTLHFSNPYPPLLLSLVVLFARPSLHFKHFLSFWTFPSPIPFILLWSQNLGFPHKRLNLWAPSPYYWVLPSCPRILGQEEGIGILHVLLPHF